MGKKKLLWILLLVFCIGGIIIGMEYFSVEGQAEPMWEVESPGEIKEIMSEGTSPYMITPWSEQKPCEQYRYADWNGNTYVSSKKQIQTKEIGEYLGSLYAYGHESLNSQNEKKNIWYIRHEKKAELYQIKGISERFAVAVHLEGEKKYYVYAREDYAPETLGALVEDLNLTEYLKISKEFECGNNLEEYTGDVTDAFWDMVLSHMEVESVRKPHHSFSVLDEEVGSSIFETAVAYKLTGWKHVLLYISEHGYIGINQPLLDPEYIFKVGEDAVEEFLKYIDLYCEPMGED